MRSRFLLPFISAVLSACSRPPPAQGKVADLVTFTSPGEGWQRSDEPNGNAVLKIKNQIVEGTITIAVYPQESDGARLLKAEAVRLRTHEGVCATDNRAFEADFRRTRFLFGTCDANGNDHLAGITVALPLAGASKGFAVVTGKGNDEESASLVILATGSLLETIQRKR